MIKCYPCEFRITSIKISLPLVRPYTIKQSTITMDANTILQVVCDYTKLSLEDLKSKRRFRPFVEARTYAAYFLQKYIHKLTLLQIGEYLGGKDHTTIIYLINSCQDLIFSNKEFKNNILAIDDTLKKIFVVDVQNNEQECIVNDAIVN
jgi:chromosomal replication initiation ATPase DnaA